jgi:tetratricopeptide (TPR) repeat protein
MCRGHWFLPGCHGDDFLYQPYLPGSFLATPASHTVTSVSLVLNHALLKYDIAQDYLFQARRQLEKTTAEKDDRPQERTMATVLHYLGRITEARGNLQEAMRLYVDGENYQQMCPEELSASAFYHLRLGELLISANRLDEAKDHISKSEKLFLQIQFSSSGTIQTALAWASIYDKEGQYGEAKGYMDKAIKAARARNFARGELYCLVKLFWLELKHRNVLAALDVFWQAMKTWRKGEIARNGGLNLVGQYLLQVLLTPIKLVLRSPHMVLGTAAFNSSLSHCTCPIHQPNNVAEVLIAQHGIQGPSSAYSHFMSDKP